MNTYQLADKTYVGTQAEAKASDQTFQAVDIPTDKKGLIDFINELQIREESSPPEGDVEPLRPQLTPEEESLIDFRQQIVEGRVDVDEWMLNAPLDTCWRLMGLITDRTRELLKRKEIQ